MDSFSRAVASSFDLRTGKLVLRNLPIKDVSVILDDLSSLAGLKELDLASCGLTGLPSDLSTLQSLEKLDVSSNRFASAKVVLPGLQSLPSLIDLSIDVPQEKDEDEIVLTLPHLQILNGTDLTSLPEDDEINEYESEIINALSNVQFSSQSQDSALGAATRSFVEESLKTEKERAVASKKFSESDPLTSVGDRIESDLLNEKPLERIDWQNAHMLFTEAQGLKGDRPSGEFDRILNGIIDRLNVRIQGSNDRFVQRGERLQAQREMLDYIFEDVIVFLHQSKPNLAAVLRRIMQSYGDLLHAFARTISEMRATSKARIDNLVNEVQRAERETNEILEAAEALERETANFETEKNRLQQAAMREKQDLNREIDFLRSENEKLLRRLRQMELNRQKQSAGSSSPAPSGPLDMAQVPSSRSSTSASPSNYGKTAVGVNPPPSSSSAFSPASAPVIKSNKDISLKQLHDFMHEIYESKSKYDVRCENAKLPRETMEQYLYTFLNQKYGLKSLILDWTAAVLHAVKKYENADNDVSVFARILRNEMDEEFRFVQKRLKETVRELLRVFLKGKYPLKLDSDIDELLRKRLNGCVHEEEWTEIVRCMYVHEDSIAILSRIKNAAKEEAKHREQVAAQQRRQQASTPRTPRSQAKQNASSVEQNKLLYETFLRILLDFQLEGHERFLRRFQELFHQFDADGNGILDAEEFHALVFALDPSLTEEEADRLLAQADANNNNIITLSECVFHLSDVLVKLIGVKGDVQIQSTASS